MALTTAAGMQAFDMMQDRGLTPNTFTYAILIEGCNYKGRGQFDVAMQIYANLRERMPSVPDYIKGLLLRVVLTAMRKATSLQDAMKAFVGLQHLHLENTVEV